MNRFLVDLKIARLRSMIITLLTRIFYIFVKRFFVGLKIVLVCEMTITLVTRISYTFMNCFLMFLKIALLRHLIPAVYTGITNTFMFTSGVLPQTRLMFITCLTFLTLVQLLARTEFIPNRDIKVNNFISNI